MFQIRKLAPGELITEPGFYDIPIDVHHGQPCDGPSVTSGILRTMEKGTPADVWAKWSANPDRWEQEDTDALRLGRAMAAFIETGLEGLEKVVNILGPDVPRRPSPAQYKAVEKGTASDESAEAVAFWRRTDRDPRILVRHTEWELMLNMAAALARDPAAEVALGASPEITMAWRDEMTGLWCLARPDQTGFSGMLTDYKKMHCSGFFSATFVDQKIEQFGYDQQMGFADTGFEYLTGHNADEIGLVCQADQPPYSVILRGIDREEIEEAKFLNREALDRIAECLASGEWPGPGEEVGNFVRSEARREKIRERMEAYGYD